MTAEPFGPHGVSLKSSAACPLISSGSPGVGSPRDVVTQASSCAANAAGDVLGHFFDWEGKEIDIYVNRRNIGLTVEELKKIPTKILVAGGKKKHNALQVAVSHHFCDILITDAASAAMLDQ